jgi:hypothetical protein
MSKKQTMVDKDAEIPGQHHEAPDADEAPAGAFTGGEEASGSGRGSNTDGANMSDEAAAPADASRGGN